MPLKNSVKNSRNRAANLDVDHIYPNCTRQAARGQASPIDNTAQTSLMELYGGECKTLALVYNIGSHADVLTWAIALHDAAADNGN